MKWLGLPLNLSTYPQWGSNPPSSDKCFQGDITTYTTQAEEAKKWREMVGKDPFT